MGHGKPKTCSWVCWRRHGKATQQVFCQQNGLRLTIHLANARILSFWGQSRAFHTPNLQAGVPVATVSVPMGGFGAISWLDLDLSNCDIPTVFSTTRSVAGFACTEGDGCHRHVVRQPAMVCSIMTTLYSALPSSPSPHEGAPGGRWKGRCWSLRGPSWGETSLSPKKPARGGLGGVGQCYCPRAYSSAH